MFCLILHVAMVPWFLGVQSSLVKNWLKNINFGVDLPPFWIFFLFFFFWKASLKSEDETTLMQFYLHNAFCPF